MHFEPRLWSFTEGVRLRILWAVLVGLIRWKVLCDVVGNVGRQPFLLFPVEEMRRVDTSAVEPMAHPQDARQRLREDRVTEGDGRERFQALAPQVEDGLYLVPQVIE